MSLRCDTVRFWFGGYIDEIDRTSSSCVKTFFFGSIFEWPLKTGFKVVWCETLLLTLNLSCVFQKLRLALIGPQLSFLQSKKWLSCLRVGDHLFLRSHWIGGIKKHSYQSMNTDQKSL